MKFNDKYINKWEAIEYAFEDNRLTISDKMVLFVYTRDISISDKNASNILNMNVNKQDNIITSNMIKHSREKLIELHYLNV